MSTLFSYLSGFVILSIDFMAISYLVKLSLQAAAEKKWKRQDTFIFVCLLIIKVVVVVGLLAYFLTELAAPAIPMFFGATTSLLLFSFYLLTKKLKNSVQS